MVEITAEELRSRLQYDQDTGEMTWMKPPKWHPDLLGKLAGRAAKSTAKKWYHVIQLNGKKYKRSRLSVLWMTGEFPSQMIDHINGNSLDDRWANLRCASSLENARNLKSTTKAANLPMGVRMLPSGRFCSRITINKRLTTIGTFDTVEQAHCAYLTARRQHFGEFHGL